MYHTIFTKALVTLSDTASGALTVTLKKETCGPIQQTITTTMKLITRQAMPDCSSNVSNIDQMVYATPNYLNNFYTFFFQPNLSSEILIKVINLLKE